MNSKAQYLDDFQSQIKFLNDMVWESRINMVHIRNWLDQFAESNSIEDDEQLQAMFMLTHFIYFGQSEIRELLKSIYRDLFRSPLLHEIRRTNHDTLDRVFIEQQFSECLDRTRFIGVGNPSESGSHLLYYFRQQNDLPKTLFINTHEIFRRTSVAGEPDKIEIRDPDLNYYIFIDDLCGSGTQATDYSKELVGPLKLEKPDAKVFYFVLFGTTDGLKAVRDLNCFDRVAAVYELDETFRSLEPVSRIFHGEASPFIRSKIRLTCEVHGTKLWSDYPLGYKGGQLLLGFNHNTPDNSLPIFWADEAMGWKPIFRRYHKDYGI